MHYHQKCHKAHDMFYGYAFPVPRFGCWGKNGNVSLCHDYLFCWLSAVSREKSLSRRTCGFWGVEIKSMWCSKQFPPELYKLLFKWNCIHCLFLRQCVFSTNVWRNKFNYSKFMDRQLWLSYDTGDHTNFLLLMKLLFAFFTFWPVSFNNHDWRYSTKTK